jgi:hypothetical protein
MITFSVSKRKMEEAVKLLDAVPTRNGITSSEFIKVQQESPRRLSLLLSSDVFGEALLRTIQPTKLEKPLYLDRRMLLPFVSAGTDFKSPLYDFAISNGQVTIKHGPRKALLENNNGATGYETLPDFTQAEHVEINEDWAAIANCALLCACFDPTSPHLNCVYIKPTAKGARVRASDTKLVFQGILPERLFPCKIPIALPLDLVDKLNLFSNGLFYYARKWAMLQFSVGRLWQAVKVECRKSFPHENIARVVQEVSRGETILQLGSQSLVSAGDRIAVYLQSVAQDKPVLKLSAMEGKKISHLYSETIGASFSEYIKLIGNAKRDCSIEWPLLAVLPILRYCKDAGTVRILEDSTQRTCLKAGSIMLVIGRRDTKKHGSRKKA